MPSLSQRRRRVSPHDDGGRRSREHDRRRHRDVEDEEEEEEEEEEESTGEQTGVRVRKHKKARRRRNEVEDEGSDGSFGQEDDNVDGDNDDDAAESQTDRQKLHHELLAKKLVRYALACEPRRLPIRRQAVKEQVLEKQGRHFRKVFPLTQEQLRGIFGMELVEWPARDEATMSVRERRKALKSQKTSSAGASSARRTSKSAAGATTAVGPGASPTADRYILLSTLSEAYRTAVFTPFPTDAASAGPLVPLPPAPDASFVGFATVIVSLLTLAGGSLGQAELLKYLGLLRGPGQDAVLADTDFLGSVAVAMGDHADDDEGGEAGGSLQLLVRQGYILRVAEASTGVGRTGGGGSGATSDGAGSNVTYYVGPRGRLEIGPGEVAAFVRHLYGTAAADIVGFERRLQASLGGQSGQGRQDGRDEQAEQGG